MNISYKITALIICLMASPLLMASDGQGDFKRNADRQAEFKEAFNRNYDQPERAARQPRQQAAPQERRSMFRRVVITGADAAATTVEKTATHTGGWILDSRYTAKTQMKRFLGLGFIGWGIYENIQHYEYNRHRDYHAPWYTRLGRNIKRFGPFVGAVWLFFDPELRANAQG